MFAQPRYTKSQPHYLCPPAPDCYTHTYIDISLTLAEYEVSSSMASIDPTTAASTASESTEASVEYTIPYTDRDRAYPVDIPLQCAEKLHQIKLKNS